MDGQSGEPVTVFDLLAAEHGGEPFEIVPALGGDLVARAPDLFKNFVFHGFYYTINSCGVQMTGAENPSRSQMSRNFSTMAALAMWRQFHVRRKSIPCTAAVATWAASVSAFAGINRLDNNARVKSSASFGYGKTRHSIKPCGPGGLRGPG
jgi:hypothetical protein